MSVVPHALTTKTKVKTFLGITGTGSDTVIDELINYVTDYIEQYCGGRRFLRSTYTNEVYDTKHGQSKIFFKQYPVASVSAVEYRSGTISSPSWVTYDANGYLLYPAEGYMRFFSKFPEVSQGTRFTYIAGYLIDFSNEGNTTLHNLPADLSLVATELVAKLHDTRKSEGVLSMTTEGQSITFAGGGAGVSISGMHKSILGNYQKIALI